MMNTGFVAFGELLLRLDPPLHQRLVQAEAFTARYTGAEANVAVSLAQFGIPAAVASRVPDNPIGQACLNYLRRYGVDTGPVLRGSDRLGILYVETGASQRPYRVVYDREHTAFRALRPGMFNWDAILKGKAWLHFSGTAPAAGPAVAAVLAEALDAARRHGLTTSCDCNYRGQLWEPPEAGRVLSGLLDRVDLFLCGVNEARDLFGMDANAAQSGTGRAEQAARQLMERFGFAWVAMPLRAGDSASENRYAGLVVGPRACAISREYHIGIVDRVGAGDAFAAGIIHQCLTGATEQDAADFAAAAACLKHTIPGDFNLSSAPEVNELVACSRAGHVRR